MLLHPEELVRRQQMMAEGKAQVRPPPAYLTMCRAHGSGRSAYVLRFLCQDEGETVVDLIRGRPLSPTRCWTIS